MDDNLRELGISDLKVAREMRRVGSAFYGRMKAYDAALSEPGTDALRLALSRNIFDGSETEAVERLAGYVRSCVSMLARQEPESFAEGLKFPDPAETVTA